RGLPGASPGAGPLRHLQHPPLRPVYHAGRRAGEPGVLPGALLLPLQLVQSRAVRRHRTREALRRGGTAARHLSRPGLPDGGPPPRIPLRPPAPRLLLPELRLLRAGEPEHRPRLPPPAPEALLSRAGRPRSLPARAGGDRTDQRERPGPAGAGVALRRRG